MFNTTDVLVNVHPVISNFGIEWCFIVQCVSVTQEVPRGIDECIHSICFTTRRATTFRTFSVHESFGCRQWGYSTGFKFNIFRKTYRQFFFWYELFTTCIAIYNRNWHAPITLARDKPIAKTEISFTFTDTAFMKCSCNIFTSLFRCLTIKFTRINQHAIFVVRFFPCIEIVVFTIVRNNRFNRQIVFMSKFPVPFVMSRRTHNGTSTIIYENIVSNPNRHLFTRHRIYRIGTGKHTFLRCFCRRAVDVAHVAHTRDKSI